MLPRGTGVESDLGLTLLGARVMPETDGSVRGKPEKS